MQRRALVIGGGALALTGAVRSAAGGSARSARLQLTPVPEGRSLDLEPVVPAGAADDAGAARTGLQAGPAPVSRPDRWWATVVGGVVRTPVVVDGVAYVSSSVSEASLGGFVAAYDAGPAGGALRWKTEVTGSTAYSPPTVAGDVVLVGARDGLYAFRQGDGEEAWRLGIGEVGEAAAAAEGVAYVGGPGGLHAVDLETGRERWHFPSEVGISRPAVADGVVYAVAGPVRYVGDPETAPNDAVVAVDAASGRERWRATPGAILVRDSTVAAGEAVVVAGYVPRGQSGDSSRAVLLALDPGTGEERWREEVDGGFSSPPSVAHGNVYIGRNNGLHATALATGQGTWYAPSVGASYDEGAVYTQPAVVGDTVYFGAFDGYLYAVDAAGRERWRLEIKTAAWGLTVADGMIYAGVGGGAGEGWLLGIGGGE